MSNTTILPYTDAELAIIDRESVLKASAIIFFIAFMGLIFNILGVTVVMKNPILKNAFGVMCFSHSIANIGVLFVFFIWAAPLTYVQAHNANVRLSKVLGQLNILFWDACVYSHLAISFNRFSSIAFPAKASSIFSRRNTLIIIGIVWSIAFMHIFPYFWYDECYIVYDPISWMWTFASTECGNVISTYTDYYTSVASFTIIMITDLTTLTLLILHRKHTHFQSNEEAMKRRNVEIRFFAQSCLQGLLFFYELFNFYYISTLYDSKWYLFFTTTFAWEICHCLDGLVVVLFHFRRSLFFEKHSRVAFFGLAVNIISVYSLLLHHKKSLNSPFGNFCLNQATSNSCALFIYLVWASPLTYMQINIEESIIVSIAGQLYFIFYNICIIMNLFISLNSLECVLFLDRSTYLHPRIRIAFIIIFDIVIISISIPFIFLPNCHILYDPILWIWKYHEEEQCGFFFKQYWNGYFSYAVSIVVFIVSVIILTLVCLKISHISIHNMKHIFLMEAFLKSTLLFTTTFIHFITSTYSTNKWTIYLGTTFCRELYFALDGLILFFFNYNTPSRRNVFVESIKHSRHRHCQCPPNSLECHCSEMFEVVGHHQQHNHPHVHTLNNPAHN